MEADRIAPPLRRRDVHVWRLRLEQRGGCPGGLAAVLPCRERRLLRRAPAAERGLRRAARGALRVILGAYLGRAPRQIRLAVAPGGKPILALPARPPLHFNVSHSGRLALIAVARTPGIGVDVERLRPTANAAAIARRFLAEEEVAGLARADAGEDAFVRTWVCKEAFVKATGRGLAMPLDSFAVDVGSAGPRLLRTAQADTGCWLLRRLRLGPGYAGAVAVRCRGARIRAFDVGDLMLGSPHDWTMARIRSAGSHRRGRERLLLAAG